MAIIGVSRDLSLAETIGTSIIYVCATIGISAFILGPRFDWFSEHTQQRIDDFEQTVKLFWVYAAVWTFITSILLYLYSGWQGLIINLIVSAVIISWFYFNYREQVNNAIRNLKIADEEREAQKARVEELLHKR